jgi:hypothetical protein
MFIICLICSCIPLIFEPPDNVLHACCEGYSVANGTVNPEGLECVELNARKMTMASYNYQLIGIPLWDEIYSLFGLYLFPPGIIFSTCRH